MIKTSLARYAPGGAPNSDNLRYDGIGKTTTFFRDGARRPVTSYVRRQHITRLTPRGNGRCIAMDAFGNVTQAADPIGERHRYKRHGCTLRG